MFKRLINWCKRKNHTVVGKKDSGKKPPEHDLYWLRQKFKTVIEVDGKKTFTIHSSGDGKLMWESYGTTSRKEAIESKLELVRIGYEISKAKIEQDIERIMNSKDLITFL